jgi:hypothetical protein
MRSRALLSERAKRFRAASLTNPLAMRFPSARHAAKNRFRPEGFSKNRMPRMGANREAFAKTTAC